MNEETRSGESFGSRLRERLRISFEAVISLFDTSGPARRRWRSWVAYGGFFFLCFLFSFYIAFPYDHLRHYLMQEIEYPMQESGRRRRSDYRLYVDELSPSRFSGVTFSGFRMTIEPDRVDEEPVVLMLDELTVRTSILSAVMGDTDIYFDAEVNDGSVSGNYEDDEETTHIEAELEDLDFKRFGVLKKFVQLPMEGVANGTIDLTVATEKQGTTGSVDLQVQGLAAGDGKAKFKPRGMEDGFTVQRVDLGDLVLKLIVSEGEGRIERFVARGRDAKLEGAGTLQLRRPLSESRLDILVRFAILDRYKKRYPEIGTALEFAAMTPQMSRAKTPDGSFQYRVIGSFGGSVRGEPAGSARFP